MQIFTCIDHGGTVLILYMYLADLIKYCLTPYTPFPKEKKPYCRFANAIIFWCIRYIPTSLILNNSCAIYNTLLTNPILCDLMGLWNPFLKTFTVFNAHLTTLPITQPTLCCTMYWYTCTESFDPKYTQNKIELIFKGSQYTANGKDHDDPQQWIYTFSHLILWHPYQMTLLLKRISQLRLTAKPHIWDVFNTRHTSLAKCMAHISD